MWVFSLLLLFKYLQDRVWSPFFLRYVFWIKNLVSHSSSNWTNIINIPHCVKLYAFCTSSTRTRTLTYIWIRESIKSTWINIFPVFLLLSALIILDFLIPSLYGELLFLPPSQWEQNCIWWICALLINTQNHVHCPLDGYKYIPQSHYQNFSNAIR